MKKAQPNGGGSLVRNISRKEFRSGQHLLGLAVTSGAGRDDPEPVADAHGERVLAAQVDHASIGPEPLVRAARSVLSAVQSVRRCS